jgi:nitrite reductase/ring-hydroxylating ferredoxin subunit
MGRLLARLIDAQAGWARPLGDFNHRWMSALFRPMRPVKDFLNGTWLGHPVHAAITDVPIGALTVVVVLDVLGQPTAADIALVVGILTMVASAVAGVADYTDTDGTSRVQATVHSALMTIALVVYVLSLILRAGAPADRAVPIALSIIGYLIVTAGAYVGGDVVYVLGNMVSRHAFRGAGGKWVALDVTEIPEGTLTKAKAGINTLVLYREGDAIRALHETCAHAGGPLSQGKVVDGCVECPWHGSRFRLVDGHLARGPAVYDQPSYEVRATDSGWEARRVS